MGKSVKLLMNAKRKYDLIDFSNVDAKFKTSPKLVFMVNVI